MNKKLFAGVLLLVMIAVISLSACDPQFTQTPGQADPPATGVREPALDSGGAVSQPASSPQVAIAPVPAEQSTHAAVSTAAQGQPDQPVQTSAPVQAPAADQSVQTEPEEHSVSSVQAEPSATATLQPQKPATSSVKLETSGGPIEGLETEGISVYKGIPFATAERFAPPEAAEPWEETLNCTQFGPTTVQANPIDGDQPMSEEDCLTMNVWTPAKSADEKLPVYVWIYGGAFAQGAGSELSYDGTAFAKDGIVMVTFNYRVNALGFFASRETYDEYGTTGCWGLLDQLMALEWVRDNIAAFGGDPDNVTVGGESAGSYSVSALITNPRAEGLFKNAIMESGSVLGIPGNNYYMRGNMSNCIESFNQMSFQFGVQDNAAGLAKLREADADVFVQMSALEADFSKTNAFMITPVFDGYALATDPYQALQDGEFNNVNLLWGFNANEGSIFIPVDSSEATYNMLTSRMFGYDQSRLVMERFPVDGNNTATDRARQVLAYGMFTAVMKPYGDALAENGNNVYAYNFNYVAPENAEAGLGAYHGSEIAYAFGNLPDGATDEQKELSQKIHALWVNFIITGDPNGDGSAIDMEWPAYDAREAQTLIMDNQFSAAELPGREDIEFMEDIMFGENGTYILEQINKTLVS